MIPQVGAPVEMSSHLSFDGRHAKKVAVFSGRKGHGLLEQGP